MKFADAIAAGYRNYFQFSGRASRREFWNFILFSALVMPIITIGLIVFAASQSIGATAAESDAAIELSTMIGKGIYFVGFVIPIFTLTLRRLRDVNRSPLWLLASVGFWAIANYFPFGGSSVSTLQSAFALAGNLLAIAILFFTIGASQSAKK